MENATKALLISGAVLIAIVLIAVGVKILNLFDPEPVKQLATSTEVAMFNSQFTQYEGERRGTEVNELIRKINLNNTRNANRQIGGTDSVDIIVTQTYVVSFDDTNKDGYVDFVNINNPPA